MQKKKIILVLSLFCIISLIIYLVLNVLINSREKIDKISSLENIPQFEFYTLDDKIFKNRDLKSSTPTVFIKFNTGCDFCQYEAKDIKDNILLLSDLNILFISNEPVQNIKVFSDKFNLDNLKNVNFLVDKNNELANKFGAGNIIPYILMYDQNQKLIKIHKGQLNVKSLLNSLNL